MYMYVSVSFFRGIKFKKYYFLGDKLMILPITFWHQVFNNTICKNL